MKRICIGKISCAHGIKGQVKLASYTEIPEEIFEFPKKFFGSNNTPISFVKIGISKNQFIAQIDGINNRTQAEQLRGEEIFIDRNDLPELTKDSGFYIEDLVNCKVYSNESLIGTIQSIENFGAGDIVSIKDENNKEIMLPFTDDFIRNIDIQNRKVTIIMPSEL